MKKNLRLEEEGDELILWDDEVLQAHVLDRVQAKIYRWAADGKSVAEIEAAFREAFRVPPEQDLKRMLGIILTQLVKQGLIDEPAGWAPFEEE